MSTLPLADFLRVLGAFCFTYLIVPALSDQRGRGGSEPPADAMPAPGVRLLQRFVYGSLAAEVVCVLLGVFRLCLPGMLLSLCAAFILYGAVRAGRSTSVEGRFWPFIYRALEDRRAAKGEIESRFSDVWHFLVRPASLVIWGLVLLLLALSAGHALTTYHFRSPATYVAAVNLAALTEGQPSTPNGALDLLAPLVPLSGLTAASILHFTGPLFVVAFVLIIAIALHRNGRSLAVVSAISIALMAFLAFTAARTMEWNPAAEAAAYWAAAAVLWPESRRDSGLAAVLAVMIFPAQWLWAAALAGTVFAASIAPRPAGQWAKHAAMLVNTSACLLAVVVFASAAFAPPQLVQYESAAKVCASIVQQFPRNEWMVVSPFQELAFTYGRGWHVELTDFVSRFTVDQVAKPDFALPYDSPDVFFFVERRPIVGGSAGGMRRPVWRYSPAESADWAAFLYTDPVGRNSLEYRAGRLLRAYALHHKDLSVFYADDDLLVFRLIRSRRKA